MTDDAANSRCLCRANMAEEASDLLGGLANTERLMIVTMLHEMGEMNVSQLVDALGANRASLSRHLGRLREQRLVTTRRTHNRVYYRLSHAKAGELIKVLGRLLGPKPAPAPSAAE